MNDSKPAKCNLTTVWFLCRTLKPYSTVIYVTAYCGVLLLWVQPVYIWSALVDGLYDKGADSSECQSAVTQTHFTISQLRTHARPRAIYEPILADRPTRACTDAFVNMITHMLTHRSNTSFSEAFTWALFALVNVNISTIFTLASTLSLAGGILPDILMHLKLKWQDFLPSLFKYRVRNSTGVGRS